ncbi:MAG: UbiD family decarboxylase [Anaerolineales bacterium]|nr:UbiD family decarboxylase [Chloroflexota bacterium]MBL6982095.1 UbiD family decarboxylase [Anaerolineales bacterium]
MTLRDYINRLDTEGRLMRIAEPISKTFEIAAVLKELEPQPVIFENVIESDHRVMGNIFCTKNDFADYFDISVAEIIPMLTRAIEEPSFLLGEPGKGIKGIAPCQEVVQLNPDLNSLPIPLHFEGDGGSYITAGVFVVKHPKYGQNLDYHRCMQFSPTEMAIRVVKGRHFHKFLDDLGQVDVAVCVGNAPNLLAAGAISVEIGIDELTIANALEPLQLVKAKTVDLLIPADAEIVLEGTVYRDRTHAEGPFVDLTETQDVVRQEPVFQVKAITHRMDPIWQALLPGALEHKLLMGMPREPTIYQKVNEVVKCLDVNINPGGCSWLHAIVQIDKHHEDDGEKAIRAAFAGHRSCKHVYVVDKDIDIYDPLQLEWAMATRFQGDRDLVMLDIEPGSSLDPSAESGTKLTTKMGFDLTAPIGETRRHYEKVPYPNVDLSRFIKPKNAESQSRGDAEI